MRPGAFRVGGNGYDDERSVTSDPPPPPRPSAPRPPRDVSLAGQPSDAMLQEADLVVELETFEAKPIRRTRQLLVVAGLMLSTAAVVAFPLAISLTRPDPPSKPKYDAPNQVTLEVLPTDETIGGGRNFANPLYQLISSGASNLETNAAPGERFRPGGQNQTC
jgi:hypothetical protein